MKILQNCWTLPCLLLFIWLPSSCLGISCYQCGTEFGEAALSCDLFAKAPVWRQFEVECPTSPPHVCSKTITHNDDATEPSEVRGCAPAENAFQVPNAMGCGQNDDQTSQTVLCLCGSSLCNGASRFDSSSMTALFVSIFLLVLSLCCTFYAPL